MSVVHKAKPLGGNKLDIVITTGNVGCYIAIPKPQGKLYAKREDIGYNVSLIIYGIPSITSEQRTQIAAFTLPSDSTAMTEIDFGNYDYISIKGTTPAGYGVYRLIEE